MIGTLLTVAAAAIAIAMLTVVYVGAPRVRAALQRRIDSTANVPAGVEQSVYRTTYERRSSGAAHRRAHEPLGVRAREPFAGER